MTKETKLQRYERLERDGPIHREPLSEIDQKRIANIARRYHTKRFEPYDYSRSSAKAEANALKSYNTDQAPYDRKNEADKT